MIVRSRLLSHLTVALAAMLMPFIANSAAPNPPSKICVEGSCVSTPAGSQQQGIKWHPGHYAWVATIKSSAATRAYHMQELDAMASDPNQKGILLGLYWGDLEGAPGDYSAGFAILDEYVARAQKNNKRLMVRIYDRIFGNIDPNNLNNGYYFPTYLKTAAYDGGWYQLNANTALNTMVKMWNPNVMDRMIALFKAYGARYDSNPYFEMVGLEETAANAEITKGGYSDAAYIAQLKRWMAAARTAWPHTGIRLQLNYFISAYAECADLVAFANTNRVALGGPDTIPPGVKDGLDWGDLAYLGMNGGINYKGKVPMVAEMQDYSLTGAFSLPDLYAGGVERGAQYFVWYNNSFSPIQWKTNIVPYIKTISGSTYSSACPANYPGCTTN